jgi:hypothetical protein
MSVSAPDRRRALRLRVRRVPIFAIALAGSIASCGGYFFEAAVARWAPPVGLFVSGSITVQSAGSLNLNVAGYEGPTIDTVAFLLARGFASGLLFALLLQVLARLSSLRFEVEAD